MSLARTLSDDDLGLENRGAVRTGIVRIREEKVSPLADYDGRVDFGRPGPLAAIMRVRAPGEASCSIPAPCGGTVYVALSLETVDGGWA
jgi:hypothetical protein